MKKHLLAPLLAILSFMSSSSLVQAAFEGIKNPVTGQLGNNPAQAESGATFMSYFIVIWRGLIAVGALAVIIYFLWGGLEWIYAGGDSGKIQKARDKITNAIIGMVLLVGSFFIIGFISRAFFGNNFDILRLTIPTI
ncbi:MAG TPA: hypothetical protein VD999_02395 [Vitreimonas sp.]|nr:hypothetical protein [Vitreimonas sp.]